MRVVVAMDSFKGSLAAREACEAVARGLRAALPDADVVTLPVADGGEGTLAAVLAATAGAWAPARVSGPFAGMTVDAGFGWMPSRGPGAFVEMAMASGLELLRPHELDPLRATTLGTGELIARALENGARRVWLAIGGSATVDAGTGAARALGWRFLDRRGSEVAQGGAGLERIARAVPPDPAPYADAELAVLCDVDNPLLGARGAARVFGPQKGATPDVVERLEAGLANLADVVERDVGTDVRTIAGGGAAGGLGAGALAFFGGTLVRGVDAVMDTVDIDGVLEGCDWVVTGEGRLDESSLHGKVVSGVASRGHRAGCGVAVLAGTVALEAEVGRAAGLALVEEVSTGVPAERALADAEALVEQAARRLATRLVGPG